MSQDVTRRTVLRSAGLGAGLLALEGWSWTAGAAPASAVSRAMDTLIFGKAWSETAHSLTTTLADTVTGGLDQSAVVFHPTAPASYWGGTAAFTMACAPTGTTYVSVKLWGDDFRAVDGEQWRLQLFCEGKQVGWQDQGAVDSLDIIDVAPRAPGRFFLHTLPLPTSLTEGKTSVDLEIRAMGRIWSYGQTPERLYYDMTNDSRGVYRVYTHADPYFIPVKNDPMGVPPVPTAREAVTTNFDAVKARVQKDQTHYLTKADPWSMDGWAYQQLAEGYLWEGSPAYGSDSALERVLKAIDGRYSAWKKDTKVLTDSDQQWQGFGRVGLVLALLWDKLGDKLDLPLSGTGAAFENASFDTGTDVPDYWYVPGGWGSRNATMARDTSVSRSGGASLRLNVAAGGGFITTHNRPKVVVVPGEIYEYGAWVKTAGTSGEGAYIDPLFFDAAGKLVGTDHKRYSTTGTHDWEYVSIELATPSTATQVELHLRVSNTGTAWFDDVTFARKNISAAASASGTVRRAAYTEMLLASREYWRQHFPHYTNQVQICAMGLYQVNRGLTLLGSADAWPEQKARSYLYQAAGMTPYLGPEDAAGTPSKPLGSAYTQVTRKGLTRELGYVGNYGEVTAWLVLMYESVVRGAGGLPAPELRAQFVNMIKARSYFRHLDVDADGHRIARLETVVGWRNEIYPGEACYVVRTDWDGHPLMAAAAFDDPDLTGWTREMVSDGQFDPQLELLVHRAWSRVGLNAFRLVAHDWDAFNALPASDSTLPGNWDAPDFLFTDEEDGVIAVKHGQELLYVSLYWRARQAVNNLARVHFVTPSLQRSATIRQETTFTPAGDYTVPDWACWDYGISDPSAPSLPPSSGFPPPGPALHNGFAGEVLHLAPIPADVVDPKFGSTVPGVETMLVGRAPFYRCAYGDYLIGMNTTTDQTFTLEIRDFGNVRNVTTGASLKAGETVTVPPLSTVVLRSR